MSGETRTHDAVAVLSTRATPRSFVVYSRPRGDLAISVKRLRLSVGFSLNSEVTACNEMSVSEVGMVLTGSAVYKVTVTVTS